jgi:hypothetical protein
MRLKVIKDISNFVDGRSDSVAYTAQLSTSGLHSLAVYNGVFQRIVCL